MGRGGGKGERNICDMKKETKLKNTEGTIIETNERAGKYIAAG